MWWIIYIIGIFVFGVANYLKLNRREDATIAGICWPVWVPWKVIGWGIVKIAELFKRKRVRLSQEFVDWAQSSEEGPDVIGKDIPSGKYKMRP
jgi:hypothetical protein